jgi:hypothetical protein
MTKDNNYAKKGQNWWCKYSFAKLMLTGMTWIVGEMMMMMMMIYVM